jgi:hypothetical protein
MALTKQESMLVMFRLQMHVNPVIPALPGHRRALIMLQLQPVVVLAIMARQQQVKTVHMCSHLPAVITVIQRMHGFRRDLIIVQQPAHAVRVTMARQQQVKTVSIYNLQTPVMIAILRLAGFPLVLIIVQ